MIDSNTALPTKPPATRITGAFLLGLLTCISCASGQDVTNPVAQPIDISLGQNGELFGQISDSAGRPVQTLRVDVRHRGQHLTQAVTDPRGQFVVENLGPGKYEFITAGGKSVARLWGKGTAPPHAVDRLTVNSFQVIRGQYPAVFHEQGYAPPPAYGQGDPGYGDPGYGDPGYGYPAYGGYPGYGAAYAPGYQDRVFGRFPALRALGIVAAVALPIALGGDDDGVTTKLPGNGADQNPDAS